MIQIFYFVISVFLLKYEIEQTSTTRAKYLYDPSLKQISRILRHDLGSVLSHRVALVVSPETETFLHDMVKNIQDDVVIVERGLTGLRCKPFYIEKDTIYFFVDKKARKFSRRCKQNELTFAYYDRSLNYSNSINLIDLFLKMYRKSKKESIDIKYKQIELKIEDKKQYKEIIFKYIHIGTIHETIYKKDNSLFNDIRDHFITFYNDITDKDVFINVSEMYIKGILSLLVSKEILEEDIMDIPEAIEDLFPFVFYKGITDVYEENNIVTGGICFDRIKDNSNLKKYVNFDKLEGFGTRFIVSGVVRRKEDSLYVEII